jgi:hypothetical protein
VLRSKTLHVTFRHPFALKGLNRVVPAGTYCVDVEEEQIDGLSFLAYRRLATFIRVPTPGRGANSVQAFLVDPKELAAAQARDSAADAPTSGGAEGATGGPAEAAPAGR